MVRYGIVGCGNISRFHFDALKKIGAPITCVADINLEAAQAKAAECKARAVSDYRELVHAPDVDVVSILSAGVVHKEIALEAIRAGKSVICEKTMTTCQEDSYELVQAILEKRTLFFMCYMKRFFSAVNKLSELLPHLGKIFAVSARSYQAWGNFYTPDHGWNMDAILNGYGGAVTNCAGSHMLDMILNLFGRPESVYTNINYYPDTQFDRKATAIFEYSDDKTVQFETYAHPLKRIGYEKNSWDEGIQITGTNGRLDLYSVMWDHPENNGVLLVHYNNETETSTEYRFQPENPFLKELSYFNECLEAGHQGEPSYIDGYNVDTLLTHMYRSSQEKRSIPIDWQDVLFSKSTHLTN